MGQGPMERVVKTGSSEQRDVDKRAGAAERVMWAHGLGMGRGVCRFRHRLEGGYEQTCGGSCRERVLGELVVRSTTPTGVVVESGGV